MKLAGAAAGALPVISFFGGFAVSEETGAAVPGASAILTPSFCCPALVKSGGVIPMEKTPGGPAAIDSAWLGSAAGGPEYSLSVDERGCCCHPFALFPEKPVEPGLYDLFVKVSRGGASRIERQPNAVRILDDFKRDFTFGAISDVHFGDPRLASSLKGFDVAETVKKEISILKENNIEFCLCCGDLTFLPPATKKELQEYQNIFSSHASFPVFSVPGNHDGYTTGAAGKINFDTFSHWNRSFGPLDFSATYGDMSIIGLNTFDKSPGDRNVYGGYGDKADTGAVSEMQLRSIDERLSYAGSNGAKSVVLIGHHNPTNTVKDVNGPFTIVPFSETGRLELLDLVKKHSPDYFFVGHVHGVHEEIFGATKIVTVPTAASLPAEGHPVGIDLVTVRNWKISAVETIEIFRL